MWVRPFREPGKLTPPEARASSSSCVRLGPGERIGEHTTRAREELLFVLEGRATVYTEGGKTHVAAGHAAFVPPETRHDVANEGETPLLYVYVTSTLGKA